MYWEKINKKRDQIKLCICSFRNADCEAALKNLVGTGLTTQAVVGQIVKDSKVIASTVTLYNMHFSCSPF